MSFNFSGLKICLFDGVHQKAIDFFEKNNFKNVQLFPDSLPLEKLQKEIADAAVVGVRSKTKLPAEILERAENLICIGRFGIGVNNIDLKFAEKIGAPVFNGPFSSTRSVAEYVIGGVFALFRKLSEKSLQMHGGRWPKSPIGCNEIRGKTLGLIGYGNIASQASVLAENIGMKVIYSDVRKVLPHGNAQQVSFDEVLQNADVISAHVPGLPSTKNMFNEKIFSKMKKGSFLINSSRGTVVNIPDLKKALESGQLRGAMLDVFPIEPKSKKEEFISELRGMENVILTPHVGGSTEESQENLAFEVAEKMINCIKFGDSSTALNFPQLSLGPVKNGNHRILVSHQNKPGILSKINDTIAAQKINIFAQVLRTSEKIGVVAVDIEKSVSDELFEKLSSLESIIQCRVIA